MSKTIEPIKDEYAHETSDHGWFDMTMRQGPIRNAQVDEVAERYAQSQTQELQEQNAELVRIVEKMVDEFENTSKSSSDILMDALKKAKELLTKYNHLKSNTNETYKI